MEKFKLNPKVTKINFTCTVEISKLEKLGWDFDEYHQNTANALDTTFEEARRRNEKQYFAQIYISGTIENPETLEAWWNWETKESTEKAETGDDEQTLKDVLKLVNEGAIVVIGAMDQSTNKEGLFEDLFIEV